MCVCSCVECSRTCNPFKCHRADSCKWAQKVLTAPTHQTFMIKIRADIAVDLEFYTMKIATFNTFRTSSARYKCESIPCLQRRGASLIRHLARED